MNNWVRPVPCNSKRIEGLLSALVVGLFIAGCATQSVDFTLPVGTRQLLAPIGSTQSVSWRSSRAEVAAIQIIPDSRGSAQFFLIAQKPGFAWITAGPAGGSRTVGPPELILNQSARQSRMALPPERPVRFRIEVE